MSLELAAKGSDSGTGSKMKRQGVPYCGRSIGKGATTHSSTNIRNSKKKRIFRTESAGRFVERNKIS